MSYFPPYDPSDCKPKTPYKLLYDGNPYWWFWEKVLKQRNGCWIWTGLLVEDHGRTCVDLLGKRVTTAYEAAWVICNGCLVPKGHHLHHTCRIGPCVNPAHLEPVTPKRHLQIHRG